MLDNVTSIEPSNLKDQWVLGKVIANNDPEKLQRIKVNIKSVLEEPPEKSPWIGPIRTTWFGIAGAYGEVGVPWLDSWVAVWFQGGDISMGLYLGSPMIKDFADNLPPELSTNYPRRYGFKDPKNNRFFIDHQTGEVRFNHYTGTFLHIHPDGTIHIHSVKHIIETAPRIDLNF